MLTNSGKAFKLEVLKILQEKYGAIYKNEVINLQAGA